MIDELSERPEGYKRRSLAKRLTKLDKALTDLEAYSLDRAFSAWLIIAGKSRSVDVSGSGIRGSEQAEPLSQMELAEVGKLREGMGKLTKPIRQQIEGLFRSLAPWAEMQPEITDWLIKLSRMSARMLARIYVDDFQRKA